MIYQSRVRGQVHSNLLTLVCCLLVVVVVSCTSSESQTLLAPTPTTGILSQAIDPISKVSPSIEEQIFLSNVIVRASLISATAGTETVPSSDGIAPTYRATQSLKFKIHEYLMGEGPNEGVVVVRSRHTYLTEPEALRVAEAELLRRNTAWDDRQGVLFLSDLSTPIQSLGEERSDTRSQTAPALEFTLSNYGVQTEWEYSIDTLSRVWLPASDGQNTGRSSNGSTTRSNQEFITDGSVAPPPVISLSDLRSEIAQMGAPRWQPGKGLSVSRTVSYTEFAFNDIAALCRLFRPTLRLHWHRGRRPEPKSTEI